MGGGSGSRLSRRKGPLNSSRNLLLNQSSICWLAGRTIDRKIGDSRCRVLRFRVAVARLAGVSGWMYVDAPPVWDVGRNPAREDLSGELVLVVVGSHLSS